MISHQSPVRRTLSNARLPLVDLILRLNELGGSMQIGRYDALEGRAPNHQLRAKNSQVVRMELRPGTARVVARSSPHTLDSASVIRRNEAAKAVGSYQNADHRR